MYSTPRWAQTFAAHCRSRLKGGVEIAAAALPPGIRTSGQRRRALLARQGQVVWHTACWVRQARGAA